MGFSSATAFAVNVRASARLRIGEIAGCDALRALHTAQGGSDPPPADSSSMRSRTARVPAANNDRDGAFGASEPQPTTISANRPDAESQKHVKSVAVDCRRFRLHRMARRTSIAARAPVAMDPFTTAEGVNLDSR